MDTSLLYLRGYRHYSAYVTLDKYVLFYMSRHLDLRMDTKTPEIDSVYHYYYIYIYCLREVSSPKHYILQKVVMGV